MKRVAVILSGSGVFDGAELQEAILTLLSLDRAGLAFECFAPNKAQYHVVNHLTGEVDHQDSRNVLVEAARINRGDVKDLLNCDAKAFDGLVVVGGFGAAKNLSDFAISGESCVVDESVLTTLKSFALPTKPALYMCIAPALLPSVYGKSIKLTIGNDQSTIDVIEKMGAKHICCDVENVVIDEENKVITTPAYMLAESISQAASGIDKGIESLITLMK